MAKVVSCQPVVMEAQVQSRASPCGICDGQGGTGTGLSFECLVSCLYQWSILIHLTLTSYDYKN